MLLCLNLLDGRVGGYAEILPPPFIIHCGKGALVFSCISLFLVFLWGFFFSSFFWSSGPWPLRGGSGHQHKWPCPGEPIRLPWWSPRAAKTWSPQVHTDLPESHKLSAFQFRPSHDPPSWTVSVRVGCAGFVFKSPQTRPQSFTLQGIYGSQLQPPFLILSPAHPSPAYVPSCTSTGVCLVLPRTMGLLPCPSTQSLSSLLLLYPHVLSSNALPMKNIHVWKIMVFLQGQGKGYLLYDALHTPPPKILLAVSRFLGALLHPQRPFPPSGEATRVPPMQ